MDSISCASPAVEITPRAKTAVSLEQIGWSVLFAGLFVLRIVYARNLRIGSDELQHLHVVWGWSRGLWQYRDVFDNHTPLFQMFCAPFFALLGERADALIPMRFGMIAFYAWSLASTYFIGARLFDRRTGRWAALAAGAWVPFFETMTEFRTDGPWAALWLAVMLVFIGGPLSVRRALGSGLLLGTAFAVSMKTVLLTAALALAALIVWILARRNDRSLDSKWFVSRVAAVVTGVSVVPGILAIFFLTHGAWKPLYYCVFQHNVVPGLGHWRDNGLGAIGLRPLAFPVVFIVLLAFALRNFRQPTADASLRSRRLLVLLAAGLYGGALYSYWPLVTQQDWAPVAPIGVVMLSAVILWLSARRQNPRLQIGGTAVLAVLVLSSLGWMIKKHDPTQFRARTRIASIAAVLKLTRPDEFVMDAKGEMLFRKRAFYDVLEQVTKARMAGGLIRDDIIPRLIETRAPVVTLNRLPEKDIQFVTANYLELSPGEHGLRVLGKQLASSQPGAFDFDVAIPANYEFAGDHKPLDGTLDGKPFASGDFIEAGRHRFATAQAAQSVFLFWKRAADAGYEPRANRSRGD